MSGSERLLFFGGMHNIVQKLLQLWSLRNDLRLIKKIKNLEQLSDGTNEQMGNVKGFIRQNAVSMAF